VKWSAEVKFEFGVQGPSTAHNDSITISVVVAALVSPPYTRPQRPDELI
jgi:hypothetical protein